MVGLAIDDKNQGEMTWAIDLQLDGGLAPTTPQQNRAIRALDVDGDNLVHVNVGMDGIDGVGNLDVGVANPGGDEECLGGWESQKARRDGEGLQ